MPRSKRNKQIELAKTKKRGLEWKKHLLEEVRSCVDSFSNIFVFSVNDMRNSKMKNVREQWKDSRFFIGKNKIMAMALGRFAEEEYKPNLHKVGQQIKGQRGLLFSNKSTEEVLSWFRSYSEGDYARSGNIATEDVKLSAGPLSFPHNLEPYLRQLGLPTSLNKGIVHLIKDHEVCKMGDVLTPEAAKILKLLGYEMAEFHITILCVWSQDGSFLQITEGSDTDKENVKKKMDISSAALGSNKKIPKLKSSEKETSDRPEVIDLSTSDIEEMEVEADVNHKTSEHQNNDLPEMRAEITNISAINIESNGLTSTPKDKLKDSIKNNEKSVTELSNEEDILELNEDPSKKCVEKISENSSNDVNQETITKSVKKSQRRKCKIQTKATSVQKTSDAANSSQDSPVFRELGNSSTALGSHENMPELKSSEKETSDRPEVIDLSTSDIEEMEVEADDNHKTSEHQNNDLPIMTAEITNISAINIESNNLRSTPKDKVKDSIKNNEKSVTKVSKEEDILELHEDPDKNCEKISENSSKDVNQETITKNVKKPQRRKCKIQTKVTSVQKKPDAANSSQDSPVFRELRNRSVKFSKKRNK